MVQTSVAPDKVRQSFQSLGSALDSGNLSDAKEALDQLKKNAPARASSSDPISAKMETLSEAVDSGDLEAAQDAFADVKKTMSERPAKGGGPVGGAGGPPPGGPPPVGAPPSGGGKSSSTSESSDSSKVYDKMDANKDGTVSWKEEQAYKLAHPSEADQADQTTASDKKDSTKSQGLLDVIA